MASIVSVVKCADYDQAHLAQALSVLLAPLGGLASFVRPGMRVLIKPNLLSPKPVDSRVTTDPNLIKSLVEMVLALGGRPAVGDGPALVGTERVCRAIGLDGYLRQRGVEMVRFQGSKSYNAPSDSPWRQHNLCPVFEEYDLVINVPKFKTHAMMLLSLAVKNIFGFSPQGERISWHGRVGVKRDTFAEMLLDNYLIVKPALSICDGVWGMEGEGPGSGDPVQLGLLAASTDALALDDVLAELVGSETKLQTNLAAARRGITSEVQLVGADLQELKTDVFRWPRNLDPGDLGLTVPGLMRGIFKRYLTDRPRVKNTECDGCGSCIKMCPVDAISRVAEQGPVKIDLEPCIRCFCCHEVCPRGAIEVARSRLLRVLNRLS
jgi:uncharacterized protein (DUF362 family)/Pyruvate/2-oxoacid:ferredoxin oxidoreductase delta subunit